MPVKDCSGTAEVAGRVEGGTIVYTQCDISSHT
jgi:hypothetical protein